jgi:hypothetical protein
MRFFNTHRSWEDWFGMFLGLVILISPWITGQPNYGLSPTADSGIVLLATILAGIVVFGLSQMEYVALQRWEEGCEMAIGLWLIVAPYVLGYSDAGVLRLVHTSLGSAVVLLAALTLWQDWEMTDQDLARRGQ